MDIDFTSVFIFDEFQLQDTKQQFSMLEYTGKIKLFGGMPSIGFHLKDWNDDNKEYQNFEGFLFKTEIGSGTGKIVNNRNIVTWEGRIENGNKWIGKGDCIWIDDGLTWFYQGYYLILSFFYFLLFFFFYILFSFFIIII